jgi:hypothetical protein
MRFVTRNTSLATGQEPYDVRREEPLRTAAFDSRDANGRSPMSITIHITKRPLPLPNGGEASIGRTVTLEDRDGKYRKTAHLYGNVVDAQPRHTPTAPLNRLARLNGGEGNFLST